MKKNNKKVILFAVCLAATLQMSAQETYINSQVIKEDLNGTARYVGMGGAMEALGADISTIGSNPAGIGLFRSSKANISFGFVSQENAKDFGGAQQTTMSFDQAGFVYSKRTNTRSFINLAFNYHKSSNFDYILSAASQLKGASQNKLSYLKYQYGMFDMDQNTQGEFQGYESEHSDYLSNRYNAVDYVYYNSLMPTVGTDGSVTYGYNDASGYDMRRAQTGYVGEYDFNASGNVKDRFYWGITFGIHDVHYHAFTQYSEQLVAGANAADAVSITLTDTRSITGTGFDLKAGFIFRPVEESPFRIGLSVSTPTWYDLKSSYSTMLDNNTVPLFGIGERAYYNDTYKFKLYTPWRFGLSAGTTVGNYLAIGASYEYADYPSTDTRVTTDGYYDYDGFYYENSESDKMMNDATKQTLKGVNTLKLGVEFRPDPTIAVRLGYNYVSPMYKTNATKGTAVDATSNAYTSTTDYTNWESTNRLTAGLGYTLDKFTVDLAYQYSAQNGKFHPFDNLGGENPSSAVTVKNNRHQLLLTLGYTF